MIWGIFFFFFLQLPDLGRTELKIPTWSQVSTCRVYPLGQQAVQEQREMERETLHVYFHSMKEATLRCAYSRAFMNALKHPITSPDQEVLV